MVSIMAHDVYTQQSLVPALMPEVQAAVREEIAERLAAGEMIGRVEGNRVITSRPTDMDLAQRRAELLARHRDGRPTTDIKSIA